MITCMLEQPATPSSEWKTSAEAPEMERAKIVCLHKAKAAGCG